MKIFYWRDKQIKNIEQWAKDRGEKMVDVTWIKKNVNPYAKRAKDVITFYKEKDTMPESFWNSLRITEANGQPTKVKFRLPLKPKGD